MHISDWLVPLSTVVVALLALIGVVFTAVRRKDPTISEIWTENSSLRDRLDKQDERLEKLDHDLLEQKTISSSYRESAEKQINILGRAFDILFRLIGTSNLDPGDKVAVEAARALRTTTGETQVVH